MWFSSAIGGFLSGVSGEAGWAVSERVEWSGVVGARSSLGVVRYLTSLFFRPSGSSESFLEARLWWFRLLCGFRPATVDACGLRLVLDWAVYDLCLDLSGYRFCVVFMFIAALVLCITCTVWYFFLSGSSAVSVVTSAVVSPKRLCRAPIGSRSISAPLSGLLGSIGGLFYLYIAGLGEQLRMWLSSLPVFLQLALCSEAECNKCDIGSLVASSRMAL
ncbi:hypothetical protein YC2023_023865 [Brassica napus]